MNQAEQEKSQAALKSVFAAFFLTGMKLAVGLFSGSLGVLAEAAHSGLDLIAALLTFFAVRVASKPADKEHPYGHGKVENLSALAETVLLLATCAWILHEAWERLVARDARVDASLWTFLVVATLIGIDLSRSRFLMAAARKHNSHALEADALHFRTDVWSSAVVLAGLMGVKLVIGFRRSGSCPTPTPWRRLWWPPSWLSFARRWVTRRSRSCWTRPHRR